MSELVKVRTAALVFGGPSTTWKRTYAEQTRSSQNDPHLKSLRRSNTVATVFHPLAAHARKMLLGRSLMRGARIMPGRGVRLEWREAVR